MGCATLPPKPVSIEERVRVEREIGVELSREFETKLSFKHDTELAIYLRSVAEKLMAGTPELHGGPVGVFVMEERQGSWRNYALPGTRLYLAAGLLKNIEFENELAAAMALELGHVLRRDVIRRVSQNLDAEAVALGPTVESGSATQLRQPVSGGSVNQTGAALAGDAWALPQPSEVKSAEYFGPRGVFTFSEEMNLDAVTEAVGILYRAGFDPRGLTALLERYGAHPAQSPYDAHALEKLLQKARRAIAENAPLRNPVVRSAAFLEIQKRIRKL